MNFIYKKGLPIPHSHLWSCLCFLKEVSYLEEVPLQQWDIKMKVSPGYYIGNPCRRGGGGNNRTGFRYKCIVNQNKNKIWCGNSKLLNETVMILIWSKTIIISTCIEQFFPVQSLACYCFLAFCEHVLSLKVKQIVLGRELFELV